MCLWLANSVFLILLLLFSGESWGQSRSPNAPAPAAGPTQSFEQKKMSLEGPIEQPSRDDKDLPAVENRAQSSLGPETDGIPKQKNKPKRKLRIQGLSLIYLKGLGVEGNSLIQNLSLNGRHITLSLLIA